MRWPCLGSGTTSPAQAHGCRALSGARSHAARAQGTTQHIRAAALCPTAADNAPAQMRHSGLTRWKAMREGARLRGERRSMCDTQGSAWSRCTRERGEPGRQGRGVSQRGRPRMPGGDTASPSAGALWRDCCSPRALARTSPWRGRTPSGACRGGRSAMETDVTTA